MTNKAFGYWLRANLDSDQYGIVHYALYERRMSASQTMTPFLMDLDKPLYDALAHDLAAITDMIEPRVE
jgi:hypothetical protein